MDFEEWYAKLGEWADEDTSRSLSYAMQRHLARHLEEWEKSRPTKRAADGAESLAFYRVCKKCLEINCDGSCDTPRR